MILKYQQGGVFTPPFVVYQPSAPVTTTETTSKKEDKKDLGIDLKDVLGLIKDLEGLDGDEIAASEALNQLFTSIEYKLNNPELAELGGFGGTGSIASEYLKIVRLVDNIKRQASEFTKARDTAIANNNLSEAAVDSRGRVMVVGQDGFEWITPEKYYEERENKEYSLVTNAELLDYRAKGLGGLAFNMQAIHTVANGMGSKQITDLINNALTSLGKMSDNTELTGYVGVTAGDLMLGIKKYEEALKKSGKYNASVQDLYNVNLLTESQSQLAALALEYIYNTLPNSAKAQLKLKSDGTDKGARTLIGALVTSKTTTKIDFNPSLVGGGTKKSSSSNKDDSEKSNPYLQYMQEDGGERKPFTYITKSGDRGIGGTGTWYPTIARQKEDMTVTDFLNTGFLGASRGKGGITFGDQPITEQDLNYIILSNEGAMVVTLPAIIDQNNNMKVNLNIIDQWKNVDKAHKEYIKAHPEISEEESEKYLAKLLKDANLDVLIDQSTGLPNHKLFGQFMVFTAYTTDKVKFNTNSKYVHKISDPSVELDSRMEKALSTNKDKDDYDIDRQDWWELFGYNDFYKASLFIPMTNDRNQLINAWGQIISENEVMSNAVMSQNFDKIASLKSTTEIQ